MNKKTIVSINLGNYGSTGKIMEGISKVAKDNGFTTYNAFPDNTENYPLNNSDIVISSDFVKKVNQKLSVYTGLNGCFAYFSTLKFLWKLDQIKPDLIHLHNLHNSYINLRLLFNYIKKHNIPVVWTLHDTWAFTGHCAYFTFDKCYKWKTGCGKCPRYKEYPYSKVDHTRLMFKLKKKWFTGIKNLVIVTPSAWLANLVKESFLKDYPIKVINNGIDLNVFKPSPSNLRDDLKIGGGYMILGVAYSWSYLKGCDVFADLAKILPSQYHIVMIGVDSETSLRLPDNIIKIKRIDSQKRLAEMYSAADVFINPTREDVLGMTNIEALACGTPVITFKTGGCVECIDESCGEVVEVDDINDMANKIKVVCNKVRKAN